MNGIEPLTIIVLHTLCINDKLPSCIVRLYHKKKLFSMHFINAKFNENVLLDFNIPIFNLFRITHTPLRLSLILKQQGLIVNEKKK